GGSGGVGSEGGLRTVRGFGGAFGGGTTTSGSGSGATGSGSGSGSGGGGGSSTTGLTSTKTSRGAFGPLTSTEPGSALSPSPKSKCERRLTRSATMSTRRS